MTKLDDCASCAYDVMCLFSLLDIALVNVSIINLSDLSIDVKPRQ